MWFLSRHPINKNAQRLVLRTGLELLRSPFDSSLNVEATINNRHIDQHLITQSENNVDQQQSKMMIIIAAIRQPVQLSRTLDYGADYGSILDNKTSITVSPGRLICAAGD